MTMKIPCHPSEPILHDWIGGLGLRVAAAAEHMQVLDESPKDICQCKAPAKAETAVQLSKALGCTPRFWIQLQANHDAAHAEAMVD